jgi:peptidoglycan-N-acetylglucosamine deacetylase
MPSAAIFTNIIDRMFARRRKLSGSQAILLTFDDGPHPDITPAVLDRLKIYRARALFFIVGSRIEKAPDVLNRILAEGHLIGNHTYEHRLEKDPALCAYLLDVRRCQLQLKQLTGVAPIYFRAPMGRRSAGALLAPRLLGLRQVLWSADSDDWKLRTKEAAISCGQRLCETVQGGDIVLLHDDNPWTVTVLDRLLPSLATRGLDLRSGMEML